MVLVRVGAYPDVKFPLAILQHTNPVVLLRRFDKIVILNSLVVVVRSSTGLVQSAIAVFVRRIELALATHFDKKCFAAHAARCNALCAALCFSVSAARCAGTFTSAKTLRLRCATRSSLCAALQNAALLLNTIGTVSDFEAGIPVEKSISW